MIKQNFYELGLFFPHKKIRESFFISYSLNKIFSCGRRGIRTPKGVSQRIYSPPRLSNSGVRPFLETSIKYIPISRNMQIIKLGSIRIFIEKNELFFEAD